MNKHEDSQNDSRDGNRDDLSYDDEFASEFVSGFPGADRLVAAGRVAPPERSVVAAAMAAVRRASAEEACREPVPDARRGHSRRRILWTAGTAAAAAAAAVLLPKAGSSAGSGAGAGTRASASARTAPEFLRQVSFVAAGGSRTTAPFWRVESIREFHVPAVRNKPGVTPQPRVTLKPGITPKPHIATVRPGDVIRFHRVDWLSRTGLTERTESGEVFWLPSGSQMSWGVADKEITWDALRTLPTTPEALKDRLVGSDPRPTAWAALFNGIDALLSRAPSSPELRAALYEVLAGIPGVRLRGTAKDGVGRTGTVVELDGGGRRSRLVIAPKTAILLETGVSTLGGADGGRLVSRTTFLSVGPARTAPRPTGKPHR